MEGNKWLKKQTGKLCGKSAPSSLSINTLIKAQYTSHSGIQLVFNCLVFSKKCLRNSTRFYLLLQGHVTSYSKTVSAKKVREWPTLQCQ